MAEQILQCGDPVLSVYIVLIDREPIARLPSRTVMGLAFSEHHRKDHLTPRRQRLREENSSKRRHWASCIVAWIRSVGGVVVHHATVHGNILSAHIPREAMQDLVKREEVAKVRPRPAGGPGESDVTTTYLCSNVPQRFMESTDLRACEPWSARPSGVRNSYLDAHHAATGALAYIEAGYDGAIGGGVGTWGHRPLFPRELYPTLTYGIRDDAFLDVNHPAFTRNGRSRFLYMIEELDSDILVRDGEYLSTFRVDEPDQQHAARCAAIAMANAYVGGDLDLTTDEARGARSGVARLVSGVAGVSPDLKINEMLDVLASDSFGVGLGGVDVISSSQKEGSGEYLTEFEFRCPSDEDARGLDIGSLAVVYSYFSEGLVFTKAAGNDHLVDGSGGRSAGDLCATGVEVSAPGASAAALSSGAINTIGLTAAEIQQADDLRGDSSGGYTLDGRTYPLLAVPTDPCGCATTDTSATGRERGYGNQPKTSGTAPRTAGSALVFKHWYLEQSGALANQPGRIIVNLLNFADGFALDGAGGTGARAQPPAPWWGLGRFRMRLFASGPNGTGPHWGTTVVAVSTFSVSVIRIGDGAPLPSGVRRLRITAWWLEMNTGDGESKAAIRMSLLYGTGAGGAVMDSVENGQDHVLRMQYDADDANFPCPPSGPVLLTIHGLSVPVEERSPATDGARRAYRSVYVTWFWETGLDPSLISCEPSTVLGPCDTVDLPELDEPEVDVPPPLASSGGLVGAGHAEAGSSRTIERFRCDLDEAIRGALRCSVGLPPAPALRPPSGRRSR